MWFSYKTSQASLKKLNFRFKTPTIYSFGGIKMLSNSWSISHVRCWNGTQALESFFFSQQVSAKPTGKVVVSFHIWCQSNIKGERSRACWWGRRCHNTSESLLFLEQQHLYLSKFTVSLSILKTGVLDECGNSSLCCLSTRQTGDLKSSSHFLLQQLWVLSRSDRLAYPVK